MSSSTAPPYSVMAVFDAAIDAVVCGSAGWLAIPAGGSMRVDWLSRSRCYRVSVDVVAGRVPDLEAALEWLPELSLRNAAVPPLGPTEPVTNARAGTSETELRL